MVDERAALPQAEGVLLWAMRAWVLGLCRQTEFGPRIRSAFAGLDAPEAAAGLGGFMEALQEGNTRTIGVDTMCATRVSADERALLDVFAHVQSGQVREAACGLRGMVCPAAVAGALGGAEDVASALAQAGHTLRCASCPVAETGLASLH